MNNIALIGDSHLGMKSNTDIMLRVCIGAFEEVIQQMKERNLKTLFHLGDFFDDRQSINVRTIRAAQEIEKKIENAGIKMIVIGGNHDFYYKNSKDVTSMSIFSSKNVKILRSPKLIKNILLVPWLSTEEEKRAFEDLAYSGSGGSYTVFGHFDIKTFFDNQFHKSYHGFDPEILYKFKRVYSGHFHKRQTQGNISYIGSMFQTDHGEENQEKGVTFLNLENLEEDFHEFKSIPKHYTIPVTTDMMNSPGSVLKEYKSIIKNNYIRLRIIGFSDNEILARIESELLRLGAITIRRNFCIVDNDNDYGEIDDEILEMGNPKLLHINYIERDEFLAKYEKIYPHIKKPILRKILNDLYVEIEKLKGSIDA